MAHEAWSEPEKERKRQSGKKPAEQNPPFSVWLDKAFAAWSKEVRDLERDSSELKQIRATLALNFPAEFEECGDSSTEWIMVHILRKLKGLDKNGIPIAKEQP